MIPEELHLNNFLSHRETHLDLRGVHVASLVGDNGAGKSALLDGITWCVWGRSRAPYGGDEDLVTHGETAMDVEFVFRMRYQGGERRGATKERKFRILRRREQPSRRSVRSTLDLQVMSDMGWQPLTDNSIRETQNRIIEHLGLEYDTFINSAYLRQGHADEFTVQTPTQRKRVLSAILGLDRWADYQQRAKDRLSEVEGRIELLEESIEEIKAELNRRAEYETMLETAQQEAQAAEAERKALQAKVDEIHRLQEQALALRRQIEDLQERIAQANERLNDLRAEEDEHRGRLDYYQSLVAQAETIEANHRAYQQAREDEEAWGEKLSQAAKLQAQKAQWEQKIAQAKESLRDQIRAAEQAIARHERAIAQARAAHESKLSDLRGQITTLKERLSDARLLAELAAAETELVAATETAQAWEVDRERLQEIEVERSRLTERNRQLRALMEETKARLDTLAQAEANCPLCRQPLTPEHHERLLEEIQAEGQRMGDEYRANHARDQALQAEKQTLQPQIQAAERAVRARPQKEQRVARLQQQVEQGYAAQERIVALEAQIEAQAAQLAAEDFAGEARQALVEAEATRAAHKATLAEEAYAGEARASLADVLIELKEVGYDAEAHEQIKARIRELRAAEADYRELEKARVGVQGEKEALKRLADEIAAQQAHITELTDQRNAEQSAFEALQPRLAEAPTLLQQLNAARETAAQAEQRVGVARQHLIALDTLEKRLEEKRRDHKKLATRVGWLTELRDAFGVNGIPAMIIEHTLPELEREANRILQQLSVGRMNIRFETQRETKAGDLRETLDIIISDEKGTRPYETFSGGEKFRVNFSIRVALSHLLAQRAGVRLRSLFIDEGFGTLDAEGRRRLVEAVKAVQDDFDLILVITHIEELRDAFPTRIQVTKTDAGSLVEVV